MNFVGDICVGWFKDHRVALLGDHGWQLTWITVKSGLTKS